MKISGGHICGWSQFKCRVVAYVFLLLIMIGLSPSQSLSQNNTQPSSSTTQQIESPSEPLFSDEKLAPFRGEIDPRSLLLGIFYGIMLVMVLYNLLIYFSLRDSVYLLYVGSTIFAMLTSLSTNKLGEEYLWKSFEGVDANLYIIFGGISMAFSSRFAAKFLNIKALSKRLNNVLWGIAGLSLLMSVLCSFFGLDPIYHFARWLVLLSFPALIIIGIYAYRKGSPFALFYVIAWVPYILGILIGVIHGAEMLPTNFFTMSSIEIGGALEVTLMSLALADRIKKLRLELARKNIEEEQLRSLILEEQKGLLQLKVDERTFALKQANATKDRFFSIIAHDLRSPLLALNGVGEKLSYYIQSNKKHKLEQLGGKIDHSIEHLNHLLNNLLYWASKERDEIQFFPEENQLTPMIEQQIALYKTIAQEKNIDIELQGEDVAVNGDRNTLGTVFRNALSNAIKFSPVNGKVLVHWTAIDDKVQIVFQDEGSGFSEDNLTHINDATFKPKEGTKGEQGFGLGLQLCRQFIAHNHGEMRINNRAEGGAEVVLYLPLFHSQNKADTNQMH